MTVYEKYSLIFQVASCVVFAIGLIVAIFQLRQLRKQRSSEHDWNRRSKAFDYSFSDDPEMLRVLTRLDAHLKVSSKKSAEISINDIEKLSKSTYPEIKNDIHFVLARLEYLCTAMKHSVADEEICKDLHENRIISFFRFFRQYIEAVRECRGSEKIFINLNDYADKWGKEGLIGKRSPTDE